VFALVIFAGCIVSIHAPAWGGDVEAASLVACMGVSIHAPRVGGDHLLHRS
jgi:hypothetical protein